MWSFKFWHLKFVRFGTFTYFINGRNLYFLLIYLAVQYRLTIFTFWLASCLGPKKQGFWPKINCNQMKLPNFVSPSSDRLSKIGHDIGNNVVQKLTLSINNSYKNQVQFFADCQQMDSQDLVISFDYSWFSAKNLAS